MKGGGVNRSVNLFKKLARWFNLPSLLARKPQPRRHVARAERRAYLRKIGLLTEIQLRRSLQERRKVSRRVRQRIAKIKGPTPAPIQQLRNIKKAKARFKRLAKEMAA